MSDKSSTLLQIGQQSYDRTWLMQHPSERLSIFRTAYFAESPIACLCNPASPIPMHLARRGEQYFLRRNPGSAERHASGCTSHSIFNTEVDQPVADYLSLNWPLTVADQGTHGGLDLTAFFEWWWNESQLCVWRPGMAGKRSVWIVYHRLRDALGEGVDQFGQRLTTRIFVPGGPANLDQLEALYAERRAQQADPAPLILVAGMINRVLDGPYSVGMDLVGLKGTFFWDQRQHLSWLKNTVGDGGQAQFAMLLVGRTKRGHWGVYHAHIEALTPEFLPNSTDSVVLRAALDDGRSLYWHRSKIDIY